MVIWINCSFTSIEGICEIWLTSEDTGAYGKDINVSLPDLLRNITQLLGQAYEKEGKRVMLSNLR